MRDVAPTIETERLRLRAHRVSDFAASFALWNEPDVYRYIGGEPATRQRAWARVLGYVGHWSLLGFGYWVVECLEGGTFVGELGFADYKRGLAPAFADVPEIGWALISQAHGRGLATEALRAVVAWGDERFANARTMCLIDPANRASARVADKLGYRAIERTTYLERDTIVYERRP